MLQNTARTILPALALAALLAPTAALAAKGGQKIAVVDLQRVLLSTKQGKKAKARFEAMQKKKRKQLKRRDNALKKREKELMEERVAIEKELAQKGRAGITDKLKAKAQAFQAKVAKFQKEVMEFQNTQRRALKGLAKKEAQLLKPIEDKIKVHIKAIAKAKGYTMVLSRVAVVYTVSGADITADVIDRMNK